MVQGAWQVPSVRGTSKKGNRTRSVLWVGLDGYWDRLEPHDDLVQAGTGQNCTVVEVSLPPPIRGIMLVSFSQYYAWSEFLPQEPEMKIITSFPVHPKDNMYISVWMGNPRTPNLIGDAVFWIFNVTTRQQLTFVTPRVSTGPTLSVVHGLEAVWVMEAPMYYGFVEDLANYNTVTIYSAFASPTDISPNWIPYQNGLSLQVTMTNGGNKLSTVEPIDGRSMRFTWHSYY